MCVSPHTIILSARISIGHLASLKLIQIKTGCFKSGMRVAVTHLWSCLCDCSPPMNRTVTCFILPLTSYYHQDTELRTHMRNEAESRSVKCILAERASANIPHVFQPLSNAARYCKSMRGLNTNRYLFLWRSLMNICLLFEGSITAKTKS